MPATAPKGANLAAIEKTIYDSILPSDPLGSRESENWEPSKSAVVDGALRTSWIDGTPDVGRYMEGHGAPP